MEIINEKSNEDIRIPLLGVWNESIVVYFK